MKAALFKSKDFPLTIEEVKKPKPVKDQVLVRLKFAALNHRDIWLMREQTQEFPNGIILGSDGAGIIEDVGEDADPLLVGAEVVINPSLDWGNNPMVQGDSFRILDMKSGVNVLFWSQPMLLQVARHGFLVERFNANRVVVHQAGWTLVVKRNACFWSPESHDLVGFVFTHHRHAEYSLIKSD